MHTALNVYGVGVCVIGTETQQGGVGVQVVDEKSLRGFEIKEDAEALIQRLKKKNGEKKK